MAKTSVPKSRHVFVQGQGSSMERKLGLENTAEEVMGLEETWRGGEGEEGEQGWH